jgi:two-component system, OmpR family, sensor kinase
VKLSRARLRLALAYGLISALAVGTLAAIAIHYGTDRLHARAEADLQYQVGTLVGQIDVNQPPTDQYDTWLVDTDSGSVTPLGDKDVEPPVMSIAQAAVQSGPASTQFSQDQNDYLLFGQKLPNSKTAIVAAYDLSSTSRAVDALRLRILLAAAGIVAVTSLAGFFVAGRSLRPARRALEQQREFLANAAHELRTPIAVIQASASQALSRTRGSEEYVRALSEIRSAAERAGTGVSDMLELARLDAGQAVPRKSPLRLDLVIEEVAASVRGDHVSVEVEPSDAVVVDADYSLVRQAVDNVLQNATRRADTVRLSVRADGRDAVVELTDDGPGFAPNLLPTVFDRYRRGDGQRDRDGSGIGLAIVRSIVEAHGGRTEAANLAEGGAMIRLRFPRAKT